MDYKSSVLQCLPGDDDCPVCRFLNDDCLLSDLMEVIQTLDAALAEQEAYNRTLVTALMDHKRNKPQ